MYKTIINISKSLNQIAGALTTLIELTRREYELNREALDIRKAESAYARESNEKYYKMREAELALTQQVADATKK